MALDISGQFYFSCSLLFYWFVKLTLNLNRVLIIMLYIVTVKLSWFDYWALYIMDVCIGGPWNGSKVLKCNSQKEHFNVKDSYGKLITYERRRITIGNRNLTFWFDISLPNEQAKELLAIVSQKYGKGI